MLSVDLSYFKNSKDILSSSVQIGYRDEGKRPAAKSFVPGLKTTKLEVFYKKIFRIFRKLFARSMDCIQYRFLSFQLIHPLTSMKDLSVGQF